MTNTYYTTLPNRMGVTVTGPDAREFLQGLITQDINLLDTSPLLYAALLTPQGKYDADFFVFESGDTITLDCDAMRAESLLQRLTNYKLRRKIVLDVTDITVIAIWGEENTLKAFSYPADSRCNALGLRGYNIDKKELSAIKAVDFDFYDKLRIKHTIPAGIRDLSVEEDTAADINLEKLNGVSFTKGCYMGQELTSRMHHRGLAKRGLYTVTITGAPLPPFTDIFVDENLIGEMRSSNGNSGLAMLRHDSLALAEKAGFAVTPPL